MPGADRRSGPRFALVSRIAGLATSTPARVGVTLALVGILAAVIDWGAFAERVSGAAWDLFALATALVFVAFVVGALRWHLLLHGAGLAIPIRETLRAYGIGVFTNNLLPLGYGADVVRSWIVGRSGKPLARAFASVVADRVSAVACLVALAWVAVIAERGGIPGSLVGLLAAMSGGGIAAGLAGIVLLRRRGLGRFLPQALRPWASEIAQVFRVYLAKGRLQGEVLALGFVYQVIVVVAVWVLAESLGLALSLTVLAVVVPLSFLAIMLPISIGGFGVREGAYVVLLAPFGISAADATLLSLLTVPATVIASAPGAVAMLLGRQADPVPPPGVSPSR